MKFLITLLACVLCSSALYAQDVSHLEYFIDADPGFGNGTAVSISQDDTVTTTFDVPTEDLSLGTHTLYVRAQNDDGTWGLTAAQWFYVDAAPDPDPDPDPDPEPDSTALEPLSPVTNIEYFIDMDPGFGNGTAVSIESSDSVLTTFEVPTEELTPGTHTLYVRAQDADSIWGLMAAQWFYVDDTDASGMDSSSPVTSIEYFFDEDPGVGMGTKIDVTTPADTVIQSLRLSTAGLEMGEHDVGIRVQNENGLWGFAEWIPFTVTSPDSQAPTTPLGLTATASVERIDLAWSANTDTDLAGYRLYRDTSSEASAPLDTVALGTTSYADTTVVAGTIYYYRLTAVDDSGNESDFSTERSAAARAPDSAAPDVPSDLAAAPADREVVLTWTAVADSDLQAYLIYREPSTDTSSPVAEVDAGTTSYTDGDLDNDTTYEYSLSARDDSGNESAVSSPVSATPRTALAAPSLRSPSDGAVVGTAEVDLSWDGVDGAAAYDIQVGTSNSFSSLSHDEEGFGGTVLSIAGLESGRYYWRVRGAYDDGGKGAWAPPRSFIMYPTTLSRSVNLTFGSAAVTTQYRMLSLPGAGTVSLSSTLSGEVDEDWTAYHDEGSGALRAFDGSSRFNFTPGRGFWLISKNAWTVEDDAEPVPLRADGTYGIPLHDGWNVVGNPFGTDVNWSAVASASGTSQPLWKFAGSYSENSGLMKPYEGYYFYNAEDLAELIVPYSTGTASKTAEADKKDAHMSVFQLRAEFEKESSAASIALQPTALKGRDDLDIFAPPSQFAAVSLVLNAAALETDYRALAREARPDIGEGQTFEIVLHAKPQVELTLSASGLEVFGSNAVYLLDEALPQPRDLRAEPVFTLRPVRERTRMRLLVGPQEFVEAAMSASVPDRLTLRANYPNPFNPSTTIEYGVPEAGLVRVEIFDALGRLIRTLIAEEQERGWHRSTWDGRDHGGRSVASGIYFSRIQLRNAVQTRVMALTK